MAIYTKKGDKGKTSVLDGKRISKSSTIIKAIGTIDELNSYLGVIGGLEKLQKNLFTINSILAGLKPEKPESKPEGSDPAGSAGLSGATETLEMDIDKMDTKLPILKNFIIYNGTPRARKLFYARSICRRAERYLVEIPNIKKINLNVLQYINRLSDYLFTLARYENHTKRAKELIWNQNLTKVR